MMAAIDRTTFLAVLFLLAGAMAGCGGGSSGDGGPAASNPPPEQPPPEDPPPEDPPPEDPPPTSDVSGTWEPEYTDMRSPSSSVLAACTGDLAGAEGTGSLPMGLACATDDPILVSQDGAEFAIDPMPCVDMPGTQASGSGTVTGEAITGRFTIAGPAETQTVFFSGELMAPHMTLSARRIEMSGGRSGACDIDPPASSLVLISN